MVSIHGQRGAAHEGDDDEGEDEDDVCGAAPCGQGPGSEPEPLHDVAGDEDADGRRNALAETAGGSDGGRLLPEVVLEVLRDEGEVADDALKLIKIRVIRLFKQNCAQFFFKNAPNSK